MRATSDIEGIDIRSFYDEFAHKEIAAENPRSKLDGKLFRKDSVDITSTAGKIIHRGIYPEEKIIEALNTSLEILNSEEIPLLARVAIFHYLFEYVHPFYDGNGRTARFIVSYFLTTRFHKLIALRLSVIIKKRRKIYYDLFKETDSDLNNKMIQLIKYQYEFLPKLVNGDKLALKIYEALLQSSVFFGSGISMEELMKITGKSRNTIKSRLDSMPEGHFIKDVYGGQKIFYRLNIMIFNRLS